jgi:hypothetical protein
MFHLIIVQTFFIRNVHYLVNFNCHIWLIVKIIILVNGTNQNKHVILATKAFHQIHKIFNQNKK